MQVRFFNEIQTIYINEKKYVTEIVPHERFIVTLRVNVLGIPVKNRTLNLWCETNWKMFQSTFSRILAFFVLFFAVRNSVQAFYPRVYHNFVIPHGIFSIRHNLDWLSCIQDCMKTEHCLSYNYDILGAQNHTCELSKCAGSITDGCSKKKLRVSRGFVYQQLKDNQNMVSWYVNIWKIITIENCTKQNRKSR